MLKNWLIRMRVMEYLHHVQFYLDLRYRKTVIYICLQLICRIDEYKLSIAMQKISYLVFPFRIQLT